MFSFDVAYVFLKPDIMTNMDILSQRDVCACVCVSKGRSSGWALLIFFKFISILMYIVIFYNKPNFIVTI